MSLIIAEDENKDYAIPNLKCTECEQILKPISKSSESFLYDVHLCVRIISKAKLKKMVNERL